MTDAFLAERAALLADGNRLRAEALDLDDAGDYPAAGQLWRQVDQITDRYKELLPEVPVARCPRDGALVRWPIDTAGLDGWFWDSEAPKRRRGPLPPAWRAMAGAVRLSEPVEHVPFLCAPGPGVPFVVTRIIESPGIQAVIAQVLIGRHTGWAITYFGPDPPGVELVNLWGTDTYPNYDDDGVWTGWANVVPKVADYDFDLEPWLRTGKLLWIEPGDDSVTLREGVDGCPFVGLDGVRRLQYVQNGRVWHSQL